ncbi:hypothetical protein TNCV_3206071 [Trichonephila clavipes]|nr:hypothetical protein TNCV_3206071 [Trichonephila clavipes]
MVEKDILEFVKAQKNIIDADSDDENEMNNEVPVPPSSKMRNVIKKKHQQARHVDDNLRLIDRNCRIISVADFQEARKNQYNDQREIQSACAMFVINCAHEQ